MASLATFVQSFGLVRFFFVGLFLLAFVTELAFSEKVAVFPRLIWFYLAISVVGLAWAIVGWLHPGNSLVGVTDALRLYVVWSVAFAVLYSLLRSRPSLRLFHWALVAAGISISVINLFGLCDYLAGWGMVSAGLQGQLELNIGVHEGYIQITSKNIGALFLIVPYLLSLQVRVDTRPINSLLTKVSLGLCLILTALSGRRALWLVTGLTPCMILLLARLTHHWSLLRPRIRRVMVAYTAAVAVVVGILGTGSLLPSGLQEYGFVRHLQAAFSAEDERTIQSRYLIDAFAESPVVGSGFGAYAGYLRSDERPWTYELTYHQMLFNLGIAGTALLGALFSVYAVFVFRILRQFKAGSAIPAGLLIAFCSLLVGAYSNPYLGSFDLLFFIGLLAYLSTFRRGFDESRRVQL